jgi:hypothetical protein
VKKDQLDYTGVLKVAHNNTKQKILIRIWSYTNSFQIIIIFKNDINDNPSHFLTLLEVEKLLNLVAMLQLLQNL